MYRVATPVYEWYRVTIRAREALERAGNGLEALGGISVTPPYTPGDALPPSAHPALAHQLYRITLVRPPAGIVECLIGHGAEQHRGLRLAEEEAFPGEWPDGQGVAWHERGAWVPCPSCGSSLVWYEAGYVPGYRICVERQHHVLLSDGGRSAKADGLREPQCI